MALRRLVAVACGLLLASVFCGSAGANVLISIDKSDQRMTVSVDGQVRHVWPVSTGRRGFGTPNGKFRPQWLARKHFSRQYYNSPMPYSIFFHEGFAIHGTDYISRLGGPASHGCVRLSPGNAKTLYGLVTEHGKANTNIVVAGDSSTRVAKRKERGTGEAKRERRAARAARRHWEDADEPTYRARRVYYPAADYSRAAAYARWYYSNYPGY